MADNNTLLPNTNYHQKYYGHSRNSSANTRTSDYSVDNYDYQDQDLQYYSNEQHHPNEQHQYSDEKSDKKLSLYKTELCRSWEDASACRYS
jgi:hypothetical protein